MRHRKKTGVKGLNREGIFKSYDSVQTKILPHKTATC